MLIDQSHMVDLSIYNNDWYKKSIKVSKLKRALWYMVNVVVFSTPLFPLYRIKIWILRKFGASIGTGVLIKPTVNIKYPWLLQIGNYVWIGENVWLDNLANIRVGNNVCISQGAMLLTGNHNYKKLGFDLMIGEIVLEDGVWVGAKSTVCPGITLFSHSVLSVASVATKNLEAYTIYQGNPALAISQREFQQPE